MKRLIPLVCAVALVTASCNTAKEQPEGNGQRVIVLGIDGGTWTVIEPLMAAGELPNLKKLYDGGLHGVLESRPPILSPVVWTTIFTGFGFAKHGVKDWKTSQSSNRRVSAIWEILRDKKKQVDVFNVPATWPPDQINGVMLSGFPLSGSTFGGNTGELFTREQLDGNAKISTAFRDNAAAIRDAGFALEVGKWSPWIDAVVKSRPTFKGKLRVFRYSENAVFVTPLYRVDDGLIVSEPKPLRSEISKVIGEPYIPEGPGWSKWADEHVPAVLYDHLDQVFSIQSKAAQEYAGGDWDLFLYVMTFVDRVSHPYWAYSEPDKFPTLDREKAKKYEKAVANAYKRSDEELGKILAKVKGTPYVMIVSDHGFQASSDTTKPIGAHHPDGIYILSGPGIKPKAGEMKFIEDVTPTIMYLMGFPLGQDMDGKPFSDVIEMLGRKPTTIPTYETAHRDSTDEPVDGDTWESLKGLGYVDGAAPRTQNPGQPGSAPAPGAAGPNSGAAPKPGAGAPNNGITPPAGMKPGQNAAQKPKPAGANAQPAPNVPPAPKDALEDWPEAPHHDEGAH